LKNEKYCPECGICNCVPTDGPNEENHWVCLVCDTVFIVYVDCEE